MRISWWLILMVLKCTSLTAMVLRSTSTCTLKARPRSMGLRSSRLIKINRRLTVVSWMLNDSLLYFVTYPALLFHSFYLLNMVSLNHNLIISMPNQHSNFAVALSILTTRGSATTVNCFTLALEVGLFVNHYQLLFYDTVSCS